MMLSEARVDFFRGARLSGGTTCPCCNKHGQVYKRKLNSRMAATLIYVYRASKNYPGRWLEVGNYCAKVYDFIPGDHGKLQWWGLLEKKADPPEGIPSGGKSEGKYRITVKGKRFVERRLKVPSHAVEYMSEVHTFVGKEIDIVEALGRHFNYHELMGQRPD